MTPAVGDTVVVVQRGRRIPAQVVYVRTRGDYQVLAPTPYGDAKLWVNADGTLRYIHDAHVEAK